MLLPRFSIRQKILLIPVVSLVLFFLLIAVDRSLKAKFDTILSESEACHHIALLLAELLNEEKAYVDSGDKSLLPEIKEKEQQILEFLQTSSIIVPGYRDPVTNNTISNTLYLHTTDFRQVMELQDVINDTKQSLYEFYEIRNGVIQQRVDEINLITLKMLMQGENIHDAKREFVNALKEFTNFDSQATLNTTELYHLNDEESYLIREQELQEKIKLLVKTCDALSMVTEDIYDRDTWVEVQGYQSEITALRYQLYDLWQERQELVSNRPVTDEALVNFTSYITQRAQEEIQTIDTLNNELKIIAMSIATLFLGICSYVVARNILIPIGRLTEGTQRIKDGDQDVRIIVENKDELGTLAEVFNDMVVKRKEMMDILAQNEQQYLQVLEATSTIPREMDLTTMKFTYFGKQAERILGYPVDSWIDFTTCAARMHPDDRDSVISKCMTATELQEDHESVYRMFHQDGSIRWIHDVVTVVSENGKPTKLIGFMHDITENKIAEQEKTILEEKLQQAQKMEAIGTLAGGIAHDFNNLLGIIIGYIGMAREDAPSDSSITNDLGKALQASYRAKDMVKQILAFSRQSHGEMRPFQPASIVREAVKMLRSSIPTTIDIQDQINPDCKNIVADPTQIHQILMNISTNAYHAMEEKGGTLKISLDNVLLSKGDSHSTSLSMGDQHVMLTISDTGPGIDPKIKEKIFDPYFTTKEIGKGTGMGLAIVHGIVTSHGGMIDVDNDPGKGTTFRVYFPVTELDYSEIVDLEENIPTGTERIMFVDDEKLLNEMAEEMLARLGYDVTALSNSPDALQTFQDLPNQFDLVITDQTMPDMTGLELSEQILRIRPDMPIILCTGFSNAITEEEVKRTGIRALTFKPFLKGDLARLIRKVLDT